MLSAIATERCSSVGTVRRRRKPEVGEPQVGSDVVTKQFPKGEQEVTDDQKITVWQGHAPDPTA